MYGAAAKYGTKKAKTTGECKQNAGGTLRDLHRRVQDVLPKLRLNMGYCIKPHVPSPIKLDVVRHRQQAGRSEYPCLFAFMFQ